MPSQYEEVNVEDLAIEDYSDDQLRDIAENDSRTTAQEKAQAELNRRENDSAGNATDQPEEVEEEELEPPVEKRVEVTLPNGETSLEQPAKEDAGFVRDSTGAEHKTHGLAAGAGQVQHQVDQSQASGHFPADGTPPAGDHTVSAVTGNDELQKIADKGGTATEDAAGYDNTGE